MPMRNLQEDKSMMGADPKCRKCGDPVPSPAPGVFNLKGWVNDDQGLLCPEDAKKTHLDLRVKKLLIEGELDEA